MKKIKLILFVISALLVIATQVSAVRIYERYGANEQHSIPYINHPISGVTANNQIRIGQVIKSGTTGPFKSHYLYSIEVLAYRIGNPTQVKINYYRLDSAGKPTGNPISSGSFNSSKLPSGEYNYGNINVRMYPMIWINKNIRYGFVVYTPNSIVNCIGLGIALNDTDADIIITPYHGGPYLHSWGATTWFLDNEKTLWFKEYGI